MISHIVNQLAFCRLYQNHLGLLYMSKYKSIPQIYCQNVKGDFEEKSSPKNHYQKSLKNGKKY